MNWHKQNAIQTKRKEAGAINIALKRNIDAKERAEAEVRELESVLRHVLSEKHDVKTIEKIIANALRKS